MQTMPKETLSCFPTVLGFPCHSWKMWQESGLQPHQAHNQTMMCPPRTSAPDVPTQTMLSTARTDTIKYRVCSNMCLEAETQLGKSVAPHVYAVRILHCLVVEDPACPDTILYMFCNITTHCISTECQQTFPFKPCHLPNLRMIRECACL